VIVEKHLIVDRKAQTLNDEAGSEMRRKLPAVVLDRSTAKNELSKTGRDDVRSFLKVKLKKIKI
jgi:hypothetical protein